MPDLKSPLRYPGGKYVLADYFEEIIKENFLLDATLIEPYAGGASISLAMLGRGAVSNIVLVERDPLLYAFWKSVITEPDKLCSRIRRIPVTLATWKRFQKYQSPSALKRYDTVELGFAGLFFNRTNFSGILNANPIGGITQKTSRYKIDCRFNKDRIIDLIQKIAAHRKQIRVQYGDALKYLERNRTRCRDDHTFIYVDPPYLQQGPKLYRYSYTQEEHQVLAEYMDRQPYPWLVSIDNHPFIRKLYRDQKIMPIFLNYVVKQSRRAEELLISNLQFSAPIYVDDKGEEVFPDEELLAISA